MQLNQSFKLKSLATIMLLTNQVNSIKLNVDQLPANGKPQRLNNNLYPYKEDLQ